MKHCQLDPTKASREEIQSEIARLTFLMNLKKNEEQAIKLFINSVYGATGSPYFVGYNTKVAEAITLQGQDIIKYTSSIINRYFFDFWHKDQSLHSKIGLQKVEKITREVSVYGDTDSVYVTFEEVVKSCDWKGEPMQLIMLIYKNRLLDYLQNCFKKFSEKYGTENIQDLELETISYSAIFLKKKKYVMDKAWKAGEGDGVFYSQQQRIDAKGVEIAQSSTPAFARKKMKELLSVIFKEKSNLNLKNLSELLKKEKKEFLLDSIENISMSSAVGDYEKGISGDQKELIVNSKCPIHVRAAGYHNYLVNNSKWKNKYQLIKSGDKVRYYYAAGDGENVFAYLPGNYPTEIAPPVDYDTQFAKCIIEPLNRFIVAIGMPPISPELIIRTKLF